MQLQHLHQNAAPGKSSSLLQISTSNPDSNPASYRVQIRQPKRSRISFCKVCGWRPFWQKGFGKVRVGLGWGVFVAINLACLFGWGWLGMRCWLVWRVCLGMGGGEAGGCCWVFVRMREMGKRRSLGSTVGVNEMVWFSFFWYATQCDAMPWHVWYALGSLPIANSDGRCRFRCALSRLALIRADGSPFLLLLLHQHSFPLTFK